MLYQFGPVTFEVYPLNTDSVSRDSSFDFVAKDIVGGMRPREAMGEGDETMSLSGSVFPDKFGGLGSIEALHAMRRSGLANILVRGDGANMGWFLLEKISERSTFLNARGVGKRIDYDLSLVRSPRGSALSYLTTLLRLIG